MQGTSPNMLAPVLFVSAGMLRTKKRDHPLARKQLYLNYGALTLATMSDRNGVPAALVHGEHEEPVAFARGLHDDGRLNPDFPLMLSIPSFYALEWSRRFCSAVKQLRSEMRIVVGGRWVTGPDPDWLREKLPDADHIVTGLGEGSLPNLLGSRFEGQDGHAVPDAGLRHALVDDYRRYQPSIETSRGCGMGCSFCEERSIPLSRLRSASSLANLFAELEHEYGRENVHPYLQSSFFLPNPRWARELTVELKARGVRMDWRCETRVDGMKAETVEHLAESGMKVIDLGLETASSRQIEAMRKARDPARYLRMASDLIQACEANGVWVKANVLLYAGETMATVAETREWLDQHAGSIKGVSVGPVVAYGPPRHVGSFLSEIGERGATPVDRGAAQACGISQLNLSGSIGADAAEEISLDLSRRYMTEEDYFDLKSFSYYPRDFTRSDFGAAVATADRTCLPFRVEPEG